MCTMPFSESLKEVVNLVTLKYFFTRELGFAGISLCSLRQAYEFCFQKQFFLPDSDLFLEQTAISSRVREMASTE